MYHLDLGWEHVFDAGDGHNGVYLYDYAGSSWFYTTPALFPTLYDFALGHSLTYQLDLKQTGRYTSNPRKFIDLSTNQLITLGPAGAAIGLLPSTPNLLSITGGGNGGGNTGHAAPGVTGSFAFTFNDVFYGANYIVAGQVYLADSTNQTHCRLDWGRPNTLDSSDGGFCTVSLVSIVNSTSDPSAVTVTLSYTFTGAAPPGDYSVIAVVCDKDVLCSPPGTVGTWTVDGTAQTTTSLSASPAAPTTAQTVTLTATVAPSGATGTVRFSEGSGTLGTGTLSGGSASLGVPALTAGSHALTAVYGGDGSHTGSTGALTLSVSTAPPPVPPVITTPSVLPQAVPGVLYRQFLAASGGTPPYVWSLAPGSAALPAGLTLWPSGLLFGTPSGAGGTTASFSLRVTDSAGLISSAQSFSLPMKFAQLSINGVSGSAETLATITVPFTFTHYDEANGANNIGGGQFYLADNAGNVRCYGQWLRPNGLVLYDTGLGTTYGFNVYLSDSFCTVSLVSVANSATDPSAMAVVLNFTFNDGFAGTYQVMNLVLSGDWVAGPWKNVGTLTIDPPPVLSVQPTVTLTDNSQSSGFYVIGDSFTITVSGPPNQPVSLSINGAGQGTQETTNSSGVYSFSGNWNSVGSFAETWYVEGVAAPNPLTFDVILTLTDASGPASMPGSYTGVPPSLPCNDITGNWIATDSTRDTGAELDLTQTGNTVGGTIYWSNFPECGVVSLSVSSGQIMSNGTFNIGGTQPYTYDNCGYAVATSVTYSVSLSGGSCSTGSGIGYSNLLPQGVPVSLATRKMPNTVTPTNTPPAPHFRVEYAAHIPVDNVVGPPRPCAYFHPGDQLAVAILQSVTVLPNAAKDYNFFPSTGPTRNFGFGSPIHGFNANLDSNPLTQDIYLGPYGGADEDGVSDDCFLWDQAGHAPTTSMQAYSATYFRYAPYSYPTQAQVHLYGSGKNPLEPLGPSITWDFNVVVDDSNPANPTAYVNYNHTCYPAHIVKVNGAVVYSYQPPCNNPLYLANCLFQLPYFGKVVGQSNPVAVPPQ